MPWLGGPWGVGSADRKMQMLGHGQPVNISNWAFQPGAWGQYAEPQHPGKTFILGVSILRGKKGGKFSIKIHESSKLVIP